MLAVCEANGMWDPDPAGLVCTKKSCKSIHSVEEDALILLYLTLELEGANT